VAKSRRRPDDDDEDDDDAPRKRGKDDDDDDNGPIKPRRKKKSAAGPTKIVLRIIGGVIGAVGLFILLYWVYTPVGTDSSMLCYFPKETGRLQGYDVDEAFKNVKLKDVHETLLNNYRQFGNKRWSEASGVKDTDVQKYLSGTANGDPEEERDLPLQDKRGELTVIRFKKEVDEAKFVASFTGAYQCEEMSGKDGKKFYQLWEKVRVPPDMHEERRDDVSLFFPNKTTLVYASTRRELREAMNKTAGKISVEGDMKVLANEVDGHYFQCSGGWFEQNGLVNSAAFNLSFLDEDIRGDRRSFGVTGTAMWWASNGNDFLYASANLYGSTLAAREIRRKLAAGYRKAQEDIYQSESGKPSGLSDPWNPPQPKQQAAGPGGFAGPAQTANAEQVKDTIEALAEYSKTARVRQRGRLVIVEGLIPHGNPEQGIFEKLWKAIGPKFQFNQGGGMAPMPGMGGMPGMPGAPAPGVPGPPGPPR
jgi:hypothetical protein